MTYGLCGSHRTGKTTLAAKLSEAGGLPLVVTPTASICKVHGIDPAEPMSLDARLFIQDKILDAATWMWRDCDGPFVSDRTPLDMIAYLMADIGGAVDMTEEQNRRFSDYVARCFEATNMYFGVVILIQPGIQLVVDPNKPTARANPAYMEHLNTLIHGLLADARLKSSKFAMPRKYVTMSDRLRYCLHVMSSIITTARDDLAHENVH